MPDIIASSSAWAECSREERNTVAALSGCLRTFAVEWGMLSLRQQLNSE
jgi:hypothetical protein